MNRNIHLYADVRGNALGNFSLAWLCANVGRARERRGLVIRSLSIPCKA